MKDVAIPERRRVQFDVQITGKPLPSVAWYHNKVLLQEDRCVKLRAYATNNTYSLVIRSASADRRGNYNCVITNPLDSVSCTANLHIEGEFLYKLLHSSIDRYISCYNVHSIMRILMENMS